MRDPITRLLRLRTAEANAARRDLADALRASDAAQAAVTAARDALPREAAAPAPAGAYADWLPAGRAAIARAHAEAAVHDVTVGLARAALTEARIATRACEQAAETQAQTRRADKLRDAQFALEDASQARKRQS